MNGLKNDHEPLDASPLGLISLDLEQTTALVHRLRDGSGAEIRYDPQTICSVTNSVFVRSLNSAANILFDLTRPAPYRMAALFPEHLQRDLAIGLIRVLDGIDATFHLEGQLRQADGTDFPAIVNGWADPVDRSILWLSITRIRPQDPAVVQAPICGDLAHAARVAILGEMTASISHEVNQPLSSIVTSAEAGLRWLGREQPDLEEVKLLLERISSSGKRASQIVSALRGMARNAEPAKEPFAIGALIEECIVIIGAELSRRQVGLRLELAPDLPDVIGDRTQILQVVVNLAVNAAQAMADGQAWNRTLAIRARPRTDDQITVEVEDSGPGVDPNVREKLFESFYTTKETGMGMGLAICRAIVEAHRSELELQSSLYLGARFSFSLPTRIDEHQKG